MTANWFVLASVVATGTLSSTSFLESYTAGIDAENRSTEAVICALEAKSSRPNVANRAAAEAVCNGRAKKYFDGFSKTKS